MDDSDQIIDVPDTPDRSANRGKLYHSGKSVLFDEGTESRPIFVNGGRKKLSIGPPNGNAHSGVSLRHTNPPAYVGGSTSSSRNIPIFRRGLAEKMPINESHDSRHGKSSSDGLANMPHANNVGKSPFPLREVSERTDSMYRNGLSVDAGERVESASNIQDRPDKCSFPTLHSNSSPKVNRQKRLVRNGCISPHNIAKAKKVAEKDDDGVLDNGVVAVAHADTRPMASSGSPVWDDLKQLVAEDSHSHRGKGKGVMNHPSSAKELDNKNKHLFSRNSLRINEKDMETADHNTGASEIIEIPGGWRSTHDRTRKMSLRSSDNEVFHTRKHHENRLSSKEKGSTVVIDGDYHRHTDSFSTEHSPAQPAGDTTASHPRSRLGSNGHRYVANTIMKRQRQGSISSSSGEGSSSSTSDDREIVFIRSPGGPSSSRSTSSGVGHRQPVIEIDDSPGPKDNTVDEVARARQLEADEMLARELQEQLYSETPVLGFGEVDEHIALALQHEESRPTVSRGSNHASDPADSLIANVQRQSHSRPSLNFSRRGSQARTSTSGRMTRFRGRFPGQPRTLSSSSSSSRGRNSVFPANMDVDMRMHILETLEAFNDMGVGRGVLRMQRDFNESDYEMLLALDENNDQHSGTSTRIINGLPQSTVQNNNFEEACAICLETPTMGDTIRHLPCLHKFHKDCIDPWLRRRTSCPVCKSSIT